MGLHRLLCLLNIHVWEDIDSPYARIYRKCRVCEKVQCELTDFV